MSVAAGVVETVDPATGTPIERIPYTAPEACDAALDTAVAAQRAWAAAGVRERADVLRQVAARLRERRDALAALAVREMGKPVVQARAEVEKCAFACEYFAQSGPAMFAEVEIASSASRSYVALRPLGVLLAIMPWNFPYWQTFRAGVPALLAGNVIVLKHAAATTRCGLETQTLFDGLFAGGPVLQTVVISDDEADARVADPRVACVTVTGSERAGVAVASAAGRALKKCVLELGGSDAFIVLRDADLDAAASTAVTARFQNNGQSCIAAKRFIVERAAYDAFLERFVERVRALRIGDPADESTELGPCARADLRESVDRQVRDSVARGARVVTGGRALDRAGFFYAPTIVEGVSPGMPMFDEEVFGPAAAVTRVEDAREAVALANLSTFGLGCDLWTRDVDAARQIAARIEAGSVFINGMVASDPRLPFGGVKRSGFGRELSTFGAHEFTNVQTIWIGPARSEPPRR